MASLPRGTVVRANCSIPSGKVSAAIDAVVISSDQNRAPDDIIVSDLHFPYTAVIRAKDVLQIMGQLTATQVDAIAAPLLGALNPMPLPTNTLETVSIAARTSSRLGAVHDALVLFAEHTGAKRRPAVNLCNWQYEVDYGCLILAPATSQMHQGLPLDTVLILKSPRYGFDTSVLIRARPISTQSNLVFNTRGHLGRAIIASLLANVSTAVHR